jgi:hypothetical protein
MFVKFVKEKIKKITIIGFLVLVVGLICGWVAGIPTYTEYMGDNRFLKMLGYETTYNYSFMNTFAGIFIYLGLVAICPAFIKFLIWTIKCLWKLVKRMIYEAFYEATKAIKDAKKK